MAIGYYLNFHYKISILLAGIIALNISALLFMSIDKAAARRGSFRIPEKLLLLMATLGGTIGIFLGSQLLKHKKSKSSFYLMLFIIFGLQIFLIQTLKIKFY
jgi:uncharacterized membrane protein YsdA (DUF1294 family)